jgi:hypothetical protein
MGALREAPTSAECDPKPTGIDQSQRPSPTPPVAHSPRVRHPSAASPREPRDRS